MCVTVWCHLCPAEAQLDESGLPRASHGVRGTDPAGDFLALLISSADTILQAWGLLPSGFYPRCRTRTHGMGAGTSGDNAGMKPEAGAGRSPTCVPPPTPPGKPPLLRWRSLFKGLLEKRAFQSVPW